MKKRKHHHNRWCFLFWRKKGELALRYINFFSFFPIFIWGEIMKRDFKYAKSITKYLENRYGKLKGSTIADNIQYVKDIVNDHTTDELKMMSKRINTTISYKKDTGYLDNHIFLFMGLLIPVFSTMAVTIINMASNFNLAYLNNFLKINEDKIKEADNLSNIFTSIDISSLVDTWVFWICLLLLIIFIGIAVNIWSIKRPINKLYSFSVIIEEAIELKKVLGDKNDETSA